MDEKRPVPETAVVTFGGARQAGRRVAGVAAAARIVRELAEAGVAEAWLVLPAGERLSPAARNDISRLSGALIVRCVSGAAPEALGGRSANDVLRLTGSHLIPAEAVADLRAGVPDAPAHSAVRLDAPGATAAILRTTAKPGDGPVSRWLNRPVSRFLSALLLRVPGLRPTHATAGTAILAALMFAALVLGGAGGLIAGALLFQAASIFDGVDGEVARATFRSSQAGAVLDSIVDVATNLLLIVGLTVNLTERGHDGAVALAAWGFVVVVLGLGAIAWRSARGSGPFSLDLVKHHYRHRFSGRLVPRLIAAATIVTSRDFFALLFAILIVAGLPMGVLYLFAVASTIWILFVIGATAAVRDPTLASRGA